MHFVTSLIKFAHSPTCNIADFISAVKIYQSGLHQLYIDPTFVFQGEEFNTFRSLANDSSMVIKQNWLFCYNCEEDRLVFKIAGFSHMVAMISIVSFTEAPKIHFENMK
jgi:hypothetical protein